MTKRLYYPREEQDTLSCTARVLECREDQDGYEICLDATVIFPEGGGQLSDQGQLCHIETGAVMAEVTHAREEGDLVFHRTDRPIQRGTCAFRPCLYPFWGKKCRISHGGGLRYPGFGYILG